MAEKPLNDLFLAHLKDIYLRGEEDLPHASQDGEGGQRRRAEEGLYDPP